jgi:subtilase family serine protease
MLSEALDRTVQGEAKHPRSLRKKTNAGTIRCAQGDRPSTVSLSSVTRHWAASTALLDQLQNPFPSNSHRWLTPERLADRLGLSLSEVEKVVTGLEAQGFTVMPRAGGGNFRTFSDTAAQVRAAFQTGIHHYRTQEG